MQRHFPNAARGALWSEVSGGELARVALGILGRIDVPVTIGCQDIASNVETVRQPAMDVSWQAMIAPRRVLHVAAGNLYGGVETFLVTLARYRETVPQFQSEFAVCFEGRLARELRSAGAVVHWLGNVRFRNPLTFARANVALARILKQAKYSAVIVHGAWPHVLLGSQVKLRGIRLITWAHGAPLKAGVLDRLAHRIRPDLVMLNSRHTGLALGPLFEGVPSRMIYCPVEPPVPIRSRAEVRRELDTPDSTLVIAFAGRFERWKGHQLLLQAAHALLTRPGSNDWYIWMCGGVQRESERQYLAELQAYVSEHGLATHVKFLGQRLDVPDILRAADLFCQPNTDPEPFGIVFVEALYAGLPIVSTNMGGASEIVTPQCGILTEPDPNAVADGLYRLLADRTVRSALAASAPGRANQLCNPELRITEIAQAIAELDEPERRARS